MQTETTIIYDGKTYTGKETHSEDSFEAVLAKFQAELPTLAWLRMPLADGGQLFLGKEAVQRAAIVVKEV